MTENSRPIIVSWIALGISIIALFFSLCKGTHSADSFGSLAIVLSILVTILVGWNIYTFIDIKGTIKQIDKMKIDIEVLRQTKEDKKRLIQNPNGSNGNSSNDD